MTPAPRLSVVMSVFNGERFLRAAVESILDQSFREFEFIIIDDGSTDGAGSLLDAYEKADPRVHVYHQINRGLIESLNFGCGLAGGDYIARMDGDDIAVRDRLAWQVAFMERHAEVAVVGGAVQFIDQSGNELRIARQPLSNDDIQRELLDQSVIWHPSVLMRKAAFCRVGGYRKVVDAEDYDLWLRIAELFQLANLPQVLLKYRLHDGQVSVARSRNQALGAAAAKAAALARRDGKPDPLRFGDDVTPTTLAGLGVSAAMQHTTLARGYLSSIRNMCDAGQFATALDMFEELHRSSELRYAARWTVADLRLAGAKLYWREGKVGRCAANAIGAAVTRPMILGRPFKPWLKRLRSALHVKSATAGDKQFSVHTEGSQQCF